ncbi:MAG: hypothetical protein ACRBBW_09890 [Cellvibrionaceae bacterium]
MNISGNHAVSPFHLVGASLPLSSPTEKPQSPAQSSDNSSDFSVTLSDRAARENSREKLVNDKYQESVNQIMDQQAEVRASTQAGADETGKADSVSLESLPPLTFFNEGDVKAYQKRLQQELSSRGIDTSVAMDLGFDYQGKVIVKNDHPDKAAIEAIFEEDMDLRNDLVKTSNYFLFKEMYQLHQQWAEKIDSGMDEEVAGVWLVNAVQSAVSKSGKGLTFEEGGFEDPFNKSTSKSLAARAYGV